MTWAQRLKRVFNIDIETCSYCDGVVKVITSGKKAGTTETTALPEVRAPLMGLFD